MCTIQYSASDKAEEVLSTLYVSSRTECKGANRPCFHGIIMFFVSLHVGTNFMTVVRIIVDGFSSDYGAWTHVFVDGIVRM